jgi:hypothetical protein
MGHASFPRNDGPEVTVAQTTQNVKGQYSLRFAPFWMKIEEMESFRSPL